VHPPQHTPEQQGNLGGKTLSVWKEKSEVDEGWTSPALSLILELPLYHTSGYL